MSFDTKLLGGALSIVVAVGCVFALLTGPSAKAQPVLWIKVFDTTTQSGAQNTVIPIYMNNYQDTVAGFNLWIQLDWPEIMEFQTDSGTVIDTTYWDCLEYEETVCVESVLTNPLGQWDFTHIDTNDILIGNFDTTGTLCSGWEWVDARSLSGLGFDLNIAAIADMDDPPPPDTTPGIGPQQGGILIKILADVFDIPDSMTERTVNMMIQHNTLDHFSFSRPDGTSIGILHREAPDTNCWQCNVWVGEVCMDWERFTTPPDCDSIEVCCPDSFEIVMGSVPYLDTIHVILEDGSVTVAEFICGDVDANGSVNVGDLSYLVTYLFDGGPPPDPLASGNVDCQGGDTPNVGDLAYLVSYLFDQPPGPAPCDC